MKFKSIRSAFCTLALVIAALVVPASALAAVEEFPERSVGGMATDPEGNVWAVEGIQDRVVKLNAAGETIDQFESATMKEPFGIDVDSEGFIWITDFKGPAVQKYNSNGELLAQFGSHGTGKGQVTWPLDIDVRSTDGMVFVTDTWGGGSQEGRVQRFSSEGQFLGIIGEEGCAQGEWEVCQPWGIVSDAEGNVWVTETGIGRVHRFGPSGNFSFETYPGMTQPAGVALDLAGDLWVGGANENRFVNEYSPAGEYLSVFGGEEPFPMNEPYGITVDGEGSVWVSDLPENRLLKQN